MIPDTELKRLASAAIIGDSSQPVKGNSTPAVSEMPSALYTKAKARFCFMLTMVLFEMPHAF